MCIFIFKILKGLVSRYTLPFICMSSRTGRKVVPTTIPSSAPSSVKKAGESSLSVKGAKLFNHLSVNLSISEHGEVLMFKKLFGQFLV